MHNFSDFATEEHQLSGEKVKIEDILNKEIVVTGHKVAKSKYPKNASGTYLTLQFMLDSVEHVLFTSSDVLINQAQKYAEKMPFSATIKKINRYYTFS